MPVAQLGSSTPPCGEANSNKRWQPLKFRRDAAPAHNVLSRDHFRESHRVAGIKLRLAQPGRLQPLVPNTARHPQRRSRVSVYSRGAGKRGCVLRPHLRGQGRSCRVGGRTPVGSGPGPRGPGGAELRDSRCCFPAGAAGNRGGRQNRFRVDSADEMAEAVSQVGGLSRDGCRQQAVARFDSDRMIRDYLNLYERITRPSGTLCAPQENL